MATPADVTLKNHSGKYQLNKTLSDDTDPVLALQGIGWMTRKAIAWATINLVVTQYTVPNTAATAIDIEQIATPGGIKTREERVLDWSKRAHTDQVFGDLVGQSRWTGTGLDGWDALDSYLKEGWLEGDGELAGEKGEFHVESYVINEKAGWEGTQIWGFAEIDGLRYYVRRVAVTKGDTTLRVRMVYDWSGKVEDSTTS